MTLTVIMMVIPATVVGELNILGFCWKEMRFIPLRKKFEAAMEDVYKYYPPKIYKIPGFYRKEIDNYIKYKNLLDFMLRNPDCCKWTDIEVYPVSFFLRLVGYSPGTVRVEYQADADRPYSELELLVEIAIINLLALSVDAHENEKIKKLSNKYYKIYKRINSNENLLKFEKSNRYKNMYKKLKSDFGEILSNLDNEKQKLIIGEYLYIKNNYKYSIKNVTYIHFDNCGRVWDPIYEYYGVRYRR